MKLTFESYMDEIQYCVNCLSHSRLIAANTMFDFDHAYDTNCSPIAVAKLVVTLEDQERSRYV